MTEDKDRNQAAVKWLMGGNAENDGRTTPPPKVTEQASDERRGGWGR